MDLRKGAVNRMAKKDYRLVLVGKNQVGLVGLKGIFEELKGRKGKPESLLKEMLVEKAGRKNCIPDSVREEYGKDLLREFKNSWAKR